MTPRTKVVVVLLALLAGCVLVGVVSHEARADTGAATPPEYLPQSGFTVALWILAGLCVLVFAIGAVTGLALIVIAGVGRLWDRRPAARRADTFNAAIAERLQRKAKYDTYAAEMYSAFRELADDQLIENVIDLWGRTYKP